MQAMHTAAGTIFFNFQALRIVFLVFRRGIVTLLALGAGEVNHTSGFSFLGHSLFYNTAYGARTYRSPSFTNGKPQTCLQGYGINQLHLHVDIVAGHDHLNTFR